MELAAEPVDLEEHWKEHDEMAAGSMPLPLHMELKAQQLSQKLDEQKVRAAKKRDDEEDLDKYSSLYEHSSDGQGRQRVGDGEALRATDLKAHHLGRYEKVRLRSSVLEKEASMGRRGELEQEHDLWLNALVDDIAKIHPVVSSGEVILENQLDSLCQVRRLDNTWISEASTPWAEQVVRDLEALAEVSENARSWSNCRMPELGRPCYQGAKKEKGPEANAAGAGGDPSKLAPEDKKASLRKQVDFYFSVDNLCKDVYLRQQMDQEGYCKLDLIANFNLVKRKYKASVTDIAEAIAASTSLELDGDKTRVRLKDPAAREKWKMPAKTERRPGEVRATAAPAGGQATPRGTARHGGPAVLIDPLGRAALLAA
ncbi:unnamed protein product [Prorocentrum cordatum]|uniref:HTH La-type RNA-binding domain-containing protein n=1 Tax=Prorocentrum cordatum TaxID=2364126 RepID=A0ABN9UJ13_9DINO|nr:unnamed protein product [Polarella glacialis]